MASTFEGSVEERVQSLVDGTPLSFEAMLATSLEALDAFSASFTDDPWLLDNLAWRVTVSFENGTLFTVTNEGECVVSDVNGKKLESPQLDSLDCEWSWNSSVAGWVAEPSFADDIEAVVAAAQDLVNELGDPTLVLPWQNFADNVIEELEVDEDSEIDEDTFLVFLLNELNSEPEMEFEGYKVKFTHDMDYLSESCAVKRYLRLEEELTQKQNWIVLSECCSTCVGGALDQKFKETPEATNWPQLILWTQNAGYWSSPAGMFRYEYSVNDLSDDQIEFFVNKAQDYGFDSTKSGDTLSIESI